MFEGKAVTLQALLEAVDHSQGQQPETYRGKAFNPRLAVEPVQLEAKFTPKAKLLYTSYSSRADLAHLDDLCSSEHVHTLILYHPFKTEDEMALLHDFGSTLQRLIQPSHRLLNKT